MTRALYFSSYKSRELKLKLRRVGACVRQKWDMFFILWELVELIYFMSFNMFFIENMYFNISKTSGFWVKWIIMEMWKIVTFIVTTRLNENWSRWLNFRSKSEVILNDIRIFQQTVSYKYSIFTPSVSTRHIELVTNCPLILFRYFKKRHFHLWLLWYIPRTTWTPLVGSPVESRLIMSTLDSMEFLLSIPFLFPSSPPWKQKILGFLMFFWGEENVTIA